MFTYQINQRQHLILKLVLVGKFSAGSIGIELKAIGGLAFDGSWKLPSFLLLC